MNTVNFFRRRGYSPTHSLAHTSIRERRRLFSEQRQMVEVFLCPLVGDKTGAP